ncbi:DUF2752 domain-containing protein [Cellulomonas olei]|uniref:DUF2752 domain-containing protein n=1 Tax=Cellulomonas sp. P4 TaxID=3142533 RepID=UPI0031BAD2E5
MVTDRQLPDAVGSAHADPRRSTSPQGGALRRVASGPLLVAGAAGAALAVLATVDPNRPGHYPTCPFLMLTGLYCPGCGSLRALHDLTQLDVAGAWGMNPLLVVALPFLVASWLAWTRRSARGTPKSRLLPGWTVNALLVLLVVYWVARNVPALAPWLAP